MDEVKFCSTGKAFGTLKYVFKNEEVACVIATATIESDKWLFFPIYMERRTICIRVGVVPSLVKVD